MLGIMLPAFLLAMYEKDGLPFEKVVRNIIRAKFLRPGIRAYRTENIYAPFAGPGAGKEDVIEKTQRRKTEPPPRVKAGRPCLLSRQSRICLCTRTVCASSRAGSIQKPWNMRTSITPWHPPRIRPPYSADGSSFLNYFDSSLPFQLSFINRRSHSRSRYQVNIPKADDNYNSVRDEFTGMLKNQIAKSNNGIERSKYITFGIPAEGDCGGTAPSGACGGRCHGKL